MSSSVSKSDDHKVQDICIAEGCDNKAVSHPEWDNEYCSVNCCYNHCKMTFKAWLLANKAAKAKINVPSSSAQDNVPGPSNQKNKLESVKP